MSDYTHRNERRRVPHSRLANKLFGVALVLSFLLTSTYAPASVNQILFGPKRYDRLKGSPTVYTDAFKGCNDGGKAVLHIANGDSDRTAVTSAEIFVNGAEVAEESDFKRQIAVIEKSITLRADNVLTVKLKSGKQDASDTGDDNGNADRNNGKKSSDDSDKKKSGSSGDNEGEKNGNDDDDHDGKSPSFLVITVIGQDCDSTPPAISAPQPADNSLLNISNPVISAQYSDGNGSGVDVSTARLTVDGRDVTSASAVTTAGISYASSGLADGLHTATVSISDLSQSPASFTWHFTTDTTAPVVRITSHQNNQYLNTPTITLSGTVDDSTAAVLVNGKPAQVTGNTFTLAGLELTEGPNTITVEATDPAGNKGRDAVTVTLDTAAPVVTITAPQAGAWLNASVLTVTGTVNEPVAAVFVNGTPATVTGTTFTLSGLPLTEGPDAITVTATDLAGNPGTGSVQVTLDTIAPVIQITSPVRGAYVNTTQITVSGSITELHPAEVRVNGTSVPFASNSFSLSGIRLTEGSNTITVTAKDLAGNESSATVTLTLDTFAPAVTITAPVSGSLTNNPQAAVSGTVSETDTTVTVNAAPAVVTGPAWSLASYALSEGPNTITATAVDRAGNTGTASVTITLDSIAPAPPVLIQPVTPTNNRTLTLTGTAEALSTVKIYAGTTLAGTTQADAQGAFSLSGVPLAEGNNAFTATATDAAGNTGSPSAPVAVTLDTAPPVVTITTPQAGAWFEAQRITVTGTINEPVTAVTINGTPAPVTGTGFSLDGVQLAEGENTITVAATDLAGNTGTGTVQVALDTLAPVIQITSPVQGAYVNTPKITVSGSITELNPAEVRVNGTSVPFANNGFSLPDFGLTEGVNTITVTAKDLAGNQSSATVTLTLDTIAPVVTITAPASGSLTNNAQTAVSGAVSETDAMVTVNTAPAVVTGQTWSTAYALTEGSNAIIASAVDRAGNTGTASIAVTLDTIPPAAPVLSQPASPTRTAATTIAGSAEAGSTVTVYAARGTGGSQQIGTATADVQGTFSLRNVVLQEGANSFTACAADAVGNRSSLSAAVSVTLDTTPPVVTITAPAGGAFLNTDQATVTGIVNEPVASVQVNGTTAAVTGLSFSAAISLAQGPNTITAVALDLAGNSGNATVSVNVDSLAPAPPVITPLATPTKAAPATVTGTAEANTAITLTLASGQTTTTTFAGTATGQGGFSFPNVTLLEGENIFTATATDAAGNRSEPSAPVTVVLDTKPPVITVTAPPNNSFTNQNSVLVTGTVNEPATLTINGTAAAQNGLAFEQSVPVTSATTFIVISAKDTAGNIASVNWVVYLDQIAPSVTITTPVDGSLTRTPAVTVSGTVSETNTTVKINNTPATVTNKSFTLANVALAEGQNTLTATVTDRAGNTGTATAGVILDTQPPVVSLTVAAEAAAGAPVTITATASDNRGLSLVEAGINGVSVWSAAPNSELSTQNSFVYSLSPDLARNSVVSVQARATDTAGNVGTATAQITITNGPTGPGYLQGEVYDDSKGLLLAGALADFTPVNGQGLARITTLEDGGYFQEAPAGDYIVTLSKTGFTSVERSIKVSPEKDAVAIDGRLTPINNQQNPIDSAGGKVVVSLNSAATGTAQATTMDLTVPANALAEQTDIRLTPISNQGLAALLPAGWSPVGAADVRALSADGTEIAAQDFAGGASLRVPALAVLNLAPSAHVVLVRYETAAHQWIVQEPGTVGTDGAYITAAIPSTGQYAFVAPDSNTLTATQGTPLPALSATSATDGVTATGRVVPPVAPASVGLKAIGEVILALNGTVLPSGTIITGKVTERFDLLSGEVVQPSDYTQDLVMYRYPCVTGITSNSELGTPNSGKVGSIFPVTPSREYTIIDLMKGKVGVDIALRQGTEGTGTMVGTEGARLLDNDGNVLVIPQNGLAKTVPIETKTVAASTLTGVVGSDFTLLRAVDVNLSNQTLTAPAELSVPAPANVSATLPIVVARAIEVRGVKKLKLVALARLSGSLITSVGLNGSNGILTSGQYFFLQAKSALGFVTGTVKDGAAKAYPSAQVTTSTCSLTDLTGSDGRYLVAATVAGFTLTASDIYKNDKGTRVDTLTAANEAKTLDVTINVTPPSVSAVSPENNATGVDPKTQIAITMSEAVRPESVTSNTIYLEDPTGTRVAGVFSLSPDGTVITFYPGQNLASETAYTLIVGHAVQDLQGYFMGQDFVSHFTIKDTTPPSMPLAGSIVATFPDADGYITVTATQGSTEATGTVLIINDTTGEIVSVKPATNGSFTGKIMAMLGNEIKILSMDAAGNQTLITYITFKSDDGRYLVTAKGGIVEGEGGSKLIIPDGALAGPTVIKITTVAEDQLPHPLPETAGFLAAVNIDTGGAQFLKPPKLSVPAPANITDIPEGSMPFVSQPADLVNADGTTEKVYVVHDSAKIVDNRVTTASPPFAGIQVGGYYVFEFPYFTVSIVDGYTYRDMDGLGGYLPGVDQPVKNAIVRSPASWEHISYSRSDGSYAHFAEVVYNAGAPCRDFRLTAIHPQTMHRVEINPPICEPPYNITHGLNFKLADGNTQFPDKTKPAISMNLQIAPGQGPDARFTAGTVPLGTEIEVPISVVDQQMGQVTLSVVYKTAVANNTYAVPVTESGSSIHTYISVDNPVPIYKYSYQTNFGFPIAGSAANRFKPNQEGTYILTLEATDAAGNMITKSLTVRAVTPGTQPDGIDGAPVLDEIVPADGSKDIMATMVMSVAFNEPVNPDTVNYNTLQLMDFGPIDPVTLVSSPTFTPVQISATVSTALENGIVHAKLSPTNNLMFGRQYQFRVTRQITDAVPNSLEVCSAQTPSSLPVGCLLPLDKEYTSTFTTKVPQGYGLAAADQFQASTGDIALYSTGTGSTYAYVTAQDEGWRVVDVTDPAAPFVTYKEKMSSGILSWRYRGAAVNQQTGILAITDWIQWNYSGGSMFGYVRFYDVAANPSHPPKVGQERLAEAYSGVPSRVAIDGNYAYVSTVMVGLQVVDIETAKISGDEPGTAIVGVLDTVNLDCSLPGSTGGKCGSPHDIVAYRAGKAVMTTFSHHLLLLDTGNPQLPQPMNIFYPPSSTASLNYEGAWAVGAVADYAYVDQDGNNQVKDLAVTVGGYPAGKVHIVDITDPYNPSVIGLVRDIQGGILRIFANDVAIDKSSGLVYVTDNNAIYVIDIKNPTDPRLLNVINQTPSTGGAMLPIGASYGIVEKDGWVYLANLNSGLKTVDLHPPVYVALTTPDIIIGQDGFPREDNQLSYSIISAGAFPIQSAAITIFKDNFPVATLSATTGMQGSATLPSTFAFDMNSTYTAQAVLNTGVGGQARSPQIELGLSQPYIMFIKCNSPCESCVENLVYANGANYTTIRAVVKKKGKSTNFSKMTVAIETDNGWLRDPGGQPSKKVTKDLGSDGQYAFEYVSHTDTIKSTLKATVKKKGTLYSLLPPYDSSTEELYNYKYYTFNTIMTDGQYDTPYSNLNSQSGIESWLGVSHHSGGAISSLFLRGIGEINSTQLTIPVDAGDAVNGIVPASGTIKIENELITYSGKTLMDGYKPAFVATGRGANGTAAVSHGKIIGNTNIPVYLQTTLVSELTPTATQINVVSTQAANQSGVLTIGSELIKYSGKTDTAFLNCKRSGKSSKYKKDTALYFEFARLGTLVSRYIHYYSLLENTARPVNPALILVHLQKEKQLISTKNPSDKALNLAMGKTINGIATATWLLDQLEYGIRVARDRYHELGSYAGEITQIKKSDNDNFFYKEPNNNNKLIRAKFKIVNKATRALFKYTNYVSYLPGKPYGGNALFYTLWTQYGF